MPGNFNSIQVIAVILLLLLAILVVSSLVFLVREIKKARKTGDYSRAKVLIMSSILTLIATAAWIFNFGWIRTVLTWTIIPLINTVVFFRMNLSVAKYKTAVKSLKLWNTVFCITYVINCLTLFDFGDVGGAYVFFGLIRDKQVVGICEYLFGMSCSLYIVSLLVQIIALFKVKKAQKVE